MTTYLFSLVVTLTLLEDEKRKIMTILMADGPSCLMRLLKAWTYERFISRGGNLLRQMLFQIRRMKKLDRVLTSIEWEQKFPLVMVQALQRGISDHTPLLVDSGEAAHQGNNNVFSFETAWFEREDFLELVAREWAAEQRGASAEERWQYKIRHLRQFLRGWAKNNSGVYRKEKERLLKVINDLDIKAESTALDMDERVSKREAEVSLAKLLREEELKWALRAKVR